MLISVFDEIITFIIWTKECEQKKAEVTNFTMEGFQSFCYKGATDIGLSICSFNRKI